MADDPKPSKPAAADSPEQAALKFKRDQLKAKLASLGKFDNSADHDIDNAKKRTADQLAEVEAALK